MKKFAKISLITAGIMLAVGMVFCLFSTIVGGRRLVHVIQEDAEFEERIESAADGVSKMLYEASDGRWDVVIGLDKKDGKQAKKEFQIPTEGLREWEINVGAGSIMIEEKEEADGYMDVSVAGSGSCDYKIEGGTLSMEGFKGITINGGKSSGNVITIKLPKDYRFKEIDAQIGAGIMSVSGIGVDSLEAEVGAGELLLAKINADRMSVEIGAGRMTASETRVKDAELSVDLGECIYMGSITGNLEADCDMGNMELYLSGSENDHNYDIECDVGNIKLGTYSFAALSTERTIQNNASSNFEINCDMGNIEIEFDEK